MSSGKIERFYLKNVENHFIFDEFAILTEYDLQKSIDSEPKSNIEVLEKDFINDIKITNCAKDNYFNMIKEIHLILKNSQNLTQNQKFAYCNSQRFYMKLYLQKISEGIRF